MPPLLELRNVTRHFAVRRSFFEARPAVLRAVDDVSLTVNQGETVGLVGESGCGKSTLARIAVRLLDPTSGDVLLDGESLLAEKAGSRTSQVQMIFQDPFSSLNPRLAVGTSIAEPLVTGGGMSRAQREALVAETLTLVGLRPEHASRYPHEFSGGQRQRIAVARAIIRRPRLVVCDEPVSSLDASVQAQVLNLLRDLQDRFGLAYLFISHDLGVVGHMSDRVAVMYLGRIVEEASRDALYASPAHPYTQGLLASAPVRDPALRGQRVPLSGDLPSPFNPPAGCAFHPRCPKAFDRCSVEVPGYHTVGHGQMARCHLYAG